MLTIDHRLTIPEHELEMSYARSSGPGGQNVNKVNSKAILNWNVRTSTALPTDVHLRFLATYKARITNEGSIVIMSDRFRDKHQNTADCRDKLTAMVLKVATPPKKRRPTKPTKGSKERRIEGKKLRTATKQARRTDW